MDARAIAWKEKGNSYYRQKRFKEALRCYSEAVQIDPLYPDAWYNLGMTCQALGYADEAVTCFERAKKYSKRGNSGYPAALHGSFQSSPEPSNPTRDNSTGAGKELTGRGTSAEKEKQSLKRLAPVIVLILALVVCMTAILPFATGTNGSGLFSFPGINRTDSPVSTSLQEQVIAKTPDAGSAIIIPGSIQDPFDIPKKFQAMKTGAVLKSFPYVVRGEHGEVNLTMYEGAASEIAKEDPYSYVGEKDRYQKFIDLPVQDAFLDPLVEAIRGKTSDPDDQARIAVSLVQQIPYDQEMLDQGTLEIRYPYQTLLDNKGVCCEKSVLLAYILHKLGYGVALFDFENEKHTAVGIRVTPEYSYKNTGYAFIETTTPLIISDGKGDYPAFGRIRSLPEVLPAGEGKVFSSVHEEWNDSREWDRLNSLGPVLDRVDYSSWQSLCRKYGIVPVTG
jgi:hypothetical protein